MRGGQRLVGLPGDELGKLRDEIGQREDARPIETPRLLDQLVQVGEFPLAEKLGQQHGVVAGSPHRFLDQPGHRQSILHRPQIAERRRRRTRHAAAAGRRVPRGSSAFEQARRKPIRRCRESQNSVSS